MKKSTIAMMLSALTLLAGPAFMEPVDFAQSDGAKFRAHLKGDEWFNWVQTQDGYTACYNAGTRDYEYMLLVDDNGSKRLDYSAVRVITGTQNAPGTESSMLPGHIKKIPLEALGSIAREKRKKRHPPKK